MEDYRLEQSGQEVQNILNGAAMQSDLTAETERAELAEQTLQGNIDIEERDRKAADLTLQGNIDAEEIRAKAAEKQNADDIDALEEKVPSGASSSNKLATEEYVDDSVATATATFRGTYNLVSDLHLTVDATEQQIATALALAIATADNNDYCFIQVPTSSETPAEIKEIDRYKFNGTAWSFEYKLNNSGFTSAQWAAINSCITANDVTKLAALPTNAQLTTLLGGKQDTLTFDSVPTEGSNNPVKSGGVYSAIDDEKGARQNSDAALQQAIEAILLLIPSAASSLNQLADKAFVNSSIATASATFRGTYNLVTDLSLTVSATHTQIATALAGAVSGEDNNDYAFVQIPTSDATPTQIAKTERYKYNGTAWEYEYDLNNSGFTADQWAAINSGITEALVTKLSALPTNSELTTALGTLTSSITAINQKIPAAADQNNKLVDTAALESYIVQVLGVLTVSYNIISTDGHVTLAIQQTDGKITSVALTTSDIASAAALNLKASQADFTALASRVTTAEGNITTLGGRMTTAEGNITSLGGRMTTAEGNITSLGGRVSTNETDIANLQQLYNNLQQSKPVPVDALPETGQQQGVIYRLAGTTSYSDYMWNGSTWVLMATYNNAIDPRPKKASQNLVTSGGVFDNMGALDVSELNATENPHTLAQYVDLSAALAAIPTDYQKGGMSIKYVQSSDNKYVQYRLMADSFTTDSTQWVICDVSIYIQNPEWIRVVTDNEDKILEGISKKGKKVQNLPVDTPANEISYIDNPEWIEVKTDENGKVIEGIKKNGDKQVSTPFRFEEAYGNVLSIVDKLNLTTKARTELKNTLGISASNVLHVKKNTVGAYNTVTEAVAAAVDGDIVFVHRGVYDNETIRAWQKTISIIGEDRYGVQIKGAGHYNNPPLEMNSGVLMNLSIYAYGETPSPNGRYAYAIHADANILADNSFMVINCTLRTKMGYGAVGMGLRGGCYVLFQDCDFIADNQIAFFMNETVTSLEEYHQAAGDQHFEFNNCKFICNGTGAYYSSLGIYAMALFEGYKSKDGVVYATFRNNVFMHKDVQIPKLAFMLASSQYWDSGNVEGNIVIDGQGTKMTNWFITDESYGNSVPVLNRCPEGNINGLN